VVAFRDRLRALGANATVRRNRGTDIDAACGQLASRSVPPPRRPELAVHSLALAHSQLPSDSE
jgi:hypothetical protein